jgi:succinyl-CoA synthetase beta subunit
MNIHEYQAKSLLRDYGAPVSEGHVATTPEEAVAAAGKLKPGGWVVKAQIHAGGRARRRHQAGEDAKAARHAERLLGKPLVTPQTGPRAGRSRKSMWSRILLLGASSISRFWSIATLGAWPSSPRPKAA